MSSFHTWFAEQVHGHEKAVESDLQMESEKVEANFFMLSRVSDAVPRQDRLSNLAQRLHLLRDQVCHGHSSPTMRGGQPPCSKISMLQPSQAEGETEPVRNLVNMSGMRPENHLLYRPKKDSHGEDRHMGPHPHLIKMAMDQIEASMPKDQVSEKVVNGKLMELKGLQLQHGVSNTMAVNMTYAQYMKRMGFKEESNKKPRSPSPAPKPSQEQLETKMLDSGRLPQEGRLGQLGCSEIRDSSPRCCERRWMPRPQNGHMRRCQSMHRSRRRRRKNTRRKGVHRRQAI